MAAYARGQVGARDAAGLVSVAGDGLLAVASLDTQRLVLRLDRGEERLLV